MSWLGGGPTHDRRDKMSAQTYGTTQYVITEGQIS